MDAVTAIPQHPVLQGYLKHVIRGLLMGPFTITRAGPPWSVLPADRVHGRSAFPRSARCGITLDHHQCE